MSADTFYQVVPMQVARNPVARAVARQRLAAAMRDFQLRIHLLPEGAQVPGDVHAAMQALTVCMFGMELAGHGDEPAISVMRGAQSALLQCAERGDRWHTADAMAVDAGLQHVQEWTPRIPAVIAARAWQRLHDLVAGEKGCA